ncbi:hypothetical protein GGX14DRAFT_668810 [Mycena pura]|uniref:Uncharacterized protein n=1 Tax=Mycena pura TaxID=153505 RepID=A0AAD6V1G2_9AGAR|nr:hypothetical protein GGX14DRAFT_668810 [Mycena pura]
MIPMSSSSAHNTSRHRSSARHPSRRRPLARSNSSLMGTIKNIVTAPLAWFATTEDFGDPPDLKGKRRRNVPQSAPSLDDSDGPPRTKRARLNSPDRQIQFHLEPQYVAPAYSQPPMGYLDPPDMVFSNSNVLPRPRSSSINLTTPSLNQFNPSNRSGITRTISVDPHPMSTSLSREPSMSFIPLDRDTSMELSSFSTSSIPRDLSMPLPATGNSLRMRTSLTPQPALPREASEPPSLSVLAQKPVFVRAPPESHQRLSSQSSSSTLGSLVDSQRRTRSPMRQHSSLLFGSGSQSQEGLIYHTKTARPPAPAERALHELDIYKTPLLPTRSRLRGGPSSPSDPSFPFNTYKANDPTDLFRPRRSSQLLLMRDDRRVSRLEKEEKTKKAKVNDTKPYAGEGGMKKLLARRMKEVEEDDVDSLAPPHDAAVEHPVESKQQPTQPPPLPSVPSDWQTSQPASFGSSLRVGRVKTSRNHIARPGRPSKRFSAAFEEDNDDAMDDRDSEGQKERQELEEAAKKLPTFEVPAGFTFAKESNAKPPIGDDANAKEPPITALPFSFSSSAVPAEPVTPFPAPTEAPAAIPQPKPLSPSPPVERGHKTTTPAVPENTAEPVENSSSSAIPNFFASSKLLAQTPPPSSLFPPSNPSNPSTNFPCMPASAPPFFPVSAPVRDAENPFWEGDAGKTISADSKPSQPSLFGAKANGGGESGSALAKADGVPSNSFGASLFDTAKKDAPLLFSTSSTFLFNLSHGSGGTPAPPAAALEPQKVEEPPKPVVPFGSMTGTGSAPTQINPPKAVAFSLDSASTSTGETPKAFSLTPAPGSNPFAAPDAPKPAFGFTFGQPQKEAPKASTATSSPFTFGAPASAPVVPAVGEPGSATPFSFGTSSAPATTGGFSFNTNTDNAESKPAPSPGTGGFSFGVNLAGAESKPVPSSGGVFTFGAPAAAVPTVRPVTPPRNDVPEFKMDESPTRDMQVNGEVKPAEPRPTLGGAGGGFSFSNPPSGSLFKQSATPAPAPFSFNATSAPGSSLFASPGSTENKPFGGGDFSGAASNVNPFAFGQNSTSTGPIDPPRPSTTGSFSFGSSGPSTSTSFGFGSANLPSSNPFAASLSGGSAPNSPSTFNQPFTFGTSAAQQSTPFSFGSSQPASPAGAVSTLPQPTTPGGFAVQTPFSAGAGSLFTMGSAPPPAGQRVLKKLPRRKN